MVGVKSMIAQLKIGVLILVLFPLYALASSHLECVGIITLKQIYAKDHTKKVVPNGKERFITSDILVHDRTFSCKGHSASLPKGTIKKVKLLLTPNIDITPKQGDHYNVLYKYNDSMTSQGFISDSSWLVNRRESSIPYVKKPLKSDTPELNSSPNQVLNVNKDSAILRGEKVLNTQLKTYRGSYFEIKYPSNFTFKPATPIERYDINFHRNEVEEITPKLPPDYKQFVNTNEAYFTSPDGLVEFFVYSPQWSGHPKNYLDISQDEKLLSHDNKKIIKKGVAHQNHIQMSWVTVQAKDGSYTRSYLHQRACHGDKFEDCVSHVFGIKYKDKKSYNQYRNAYIAFKASLVQSAD